jgi:transcriptional regulator with XRE-family HTH domain
MSRAVVAEMIRRGFDALGVQQRELAARVGVDPATVNKWLKGNQLPGPSVVPLLAAALDIDERELSQAIMTAQRTETRLARREAANATARHENDLMEMRQIVKDNRDINYQIGSDISEIKANFKELTKELRQINRSMSRIVELLETRAEDARSS